MREQSKILVAFTALAWVLAGMPGIGAELKYEPKLTYAPTDPIVTGTPLILGNPETTVVKEHSKAEFNVQADSPDPLVFPQLSYQWQRRGPGLTNFLDIEGATKSTYGIAHASTKDVAYYRVQVSSAIGKSTSLPAQLLVYTHHSPLTVYGSPVPTPGPGPGCPPPYTGYVNYKKTAANGWGWGPDHANSNATHTVADGNRGDTSVSALGNIDDSFCQETTVSNTHSGAPAPEDTLYRFTIVFTNNVPTSPYPITLNGFKP